MERLKADHAALEASLIASHVEEEKKIAEALQRNKYFYSYAKNKSTIKPGIGTFKVDGEIAICATQ